VITTKKIIKTPRQDIKNNNPAASRMLEKDKKIGTGIIQNKTKENTQTLHQLTS
jgi:hypothetical protein